MPYVLPPQRGVIRVSGAAAASFLQGLVTNDVLKLARAPILYAALLTPQGKFLHDFFLMREGDAILMDCEKSRQADLMQRLTLYRLRSPVAIDALPETFAVAALWDEPEQSWGAADGAPLVFADPRAKALGWRIAGETAAIEAWCRGHGIVAADAGAYDRKRLEVGAPDGSRDLIPEKSFPLHFGFEYLHGVDFAKGCYVGQEVTARMKHLGQIRKFLYKVTGESGGLPPPGTPIYAGDRPAGQMRSSHGAAGLALLDVETAASGASMRCGDSALTARLPEWAAGFA